jgi:hypothetical protein
MVGYILEIVNGVLYYILAGPADCRCGWTSIDV